MRESERYRIVGGNHVGDVADGECLAGLEPESDGGADSGVSAGEHHELKKRSDDGQDPR